MANIEYDRHTASRNLVVDNKDDIQDDIDILEYMQYAIETVRSNLVAYLIEQFNSASANPNAMNDKAAFKEYVQLKVAQYGLEVNDFDGMLARASRNTKNAIVELDKKFNAKVRVPLVDDWSFFEQYSSYGVLKPIVTTNAYYDPQAKEKTIQIFGILEKLFGKDYWTLSKPAILNVPDVDYFEKYDIDKAGVADDEEGVAWTIEFFGKTLAIAPALTKRKAGVKYVSITDLTQKTNDEKLSKQELDDRIFEYKIAVAKARKLTIYTEFEMSSDWVKYATQSLKPTASDLHLFISSVTSAVMTDDEVSDKYMSLSGILASQKGMRQIKRWNEYNLMVSADNVPAYLPLINKAAEWEASYAQGQKTELGFTQGDILKEKLPAQAENDEAEPAQKGALEQNKIISYDAVNSRMTYVSNGRIVAEDFSNYVALEPQHASNILATSLSRGTSMHGALNDLAFIVRRHPEVVNSIKIDPEWFQYTVYEGSQIASISGTSALDITALEKRIKEQLLSASGLTVYLQEVWGSMAAAKGRYAMYDRMREDWDYPESAKWLRDRETTKLTMRDLVLNTEVLPLRPLAQVLINIGEVINKSPVTYLETEQAVSTALPAVGTALFAHHYMRDTSKLDKQIEVYRKSIMKANPKKDWKAFGLPGIKKGFQFLPHQGGVQQTLQHNPKLVVLACDAGGGKTSMALTTIMRTITEGNHKRPLVICPANLIPNYVQDLIMMAGSNWNIVPISNDTMSMHGEDYIRALVNKAPPNTIYVTEYNFIRGGQNSNYDMPYGPTTIRVSERASLLLELQFDAAFVDESHTIKNPNSQTTIAALKVLSSMNTIYLMSGTVIHGTAVDLYSQISALDPTVFGSWKDFVQEYTLGENRGKIIGFKDGAEKRMWEAINRSITYIQVKKREWAALLPERVEEFHFVTLSPTQQKVYDAILTEVVDAIREDENIKKKLKAAEDSGEEDVDIEGQLNMYLARIEKFLAAPATDPLGKDLLEGDDLMSPKATAINKLVEKHIKSGDKGKILIFTSYIPSAEEIYKYLKPEYQKKFILYTSGNKAKDMVTFKTDPTKIGMIGVEQSLNTGHNLQFCSRLIRVEGVWSPGTLEQGESRLFRPDVTNKYGLKQKYVDWVLANKTVDIAKVARLISKILSNASLEEYGNPLFDNLPALPIIKMNVSTIEEKNDWTDSLAEYIDGYNNEYRVAVKKDYEAWSNNPYALKNNFDVPVQPMMKGAAYLEGVPYVDGMTLPHQDDLGLVSMTEVANKKGESLDTFDPTGLHVHTEFGDGVVVKNYKNAVWVKVGSTTFKSMSKGKIFVFEDQKTSTKRKKTIKQELREMAGLPALTITDADIRNAADSAVTHQTDEEHEPITSDKKLKKQLKKEAEELEQIDRSVNETVQPDEEKKPKERPRKPTPNIDLDKNSEIEVFLAAVNDQICVSVSSEDPDAEARLMEGLGFTNAPKPYAYAEISSKMKMRNLYNAVHKYMDAGNIVVPKKLQAELEAVFQAFEQSKSRATMLDVLDAGEMRVYYQLRLRMPKDPKQVNLYFHVEDDVLYAIIDLANGKRGRMFINRKIQGIEWDTDDGDWRAFFRTKKEAKAFIKSLRSKVTISNYDDLKDDYANLTIRRR